MGVDTRRNKDRAARLLAEHFEDLPDPRVERTRLHPLINVIFIAVCAVIGGADGWDSIASFARARRDWFRGFLDLTDGVPSADTFRRVFEALDAKALEERLMSWVSSVCEPLRGQVIATDGKSVKGAVGRDGSLGPLHLAHVWATEQRLLLAQRAVDGAPGEIGAVPELLRLLDIKGAAVTADANGCTAATTQAVREQKANYVLALKGNRGTLHDFVKRQFATIRKVQEGGAVTVTRGHGRTEVRTVWTLEPEEWPAAEGWQDLRSAVMVRRARLVDGRTKVEWAYVVSNLPKNSRLLKKATRQHWHVENGLHWVLDVAFGEDDCRIRDQNAARNFATMNRFALMLLRRESSLKHGRVSASSGAGLRGFRCQVSPHRIRTGSSVLPRKIQRSSGFGP